MACALSLWTVIHLKLLYEAVLECLTQEALDGPDTPVGGSHTGRFVIDLCHVSHLQAPASRVISKLCIAYQ